MEEKTLLFDDWAMYLTEQWLGIRREYNRIVDARQQRLVKSNNTQLTELRELEDQAYFDLFMYLLALLEYDVARHRCGYEAYITLTASCFESLEKLRDMRQTSLTGKHNIGEFGKNFAKVEYAFRECLAQAGSALFKHENDS